MKKSVFRLGLCLILAVVVSGVAFAQVTGDGRDTTKPGELDNPKDFSRDFQVGPPDGPGTPQITEDFEGGTPPAGWQVIDNEGTGVVWTNIAGCGEAGNFTNGAGDAACVSSDVAGVIDYDTELWTESYNFCDSINSVLNFTANYQNLAGLDFFEVDYSTDGGTNWTNILSWNEDHGAFRSPPGEDVSLGLGVLDGEPDVWFRFHYYDPTTSPDFDWYIQVDDFELASDGVITAPGGGGVCAVPTMNSVGLAVLTVLLLVGGSALLLRRRTV